MARSARSSKLETRTARLRLPVAKKPVYVKIGPGISLGYRRNQSAGTWVARVADGKGGNWTKRVGVADDFDDLDENTIFDYWQAHRRVHALARAGNEEAGDSSKPIIVAQALADYERDLSARGGDLANVARVRLHVPPALSGKAVSLLTARELRRFRDGLLRHGLAPATVNRISHAAKAAFNLAANHDPRIANRPAWQIGLASLHDAEESRNVILSENYIRRIVGAAYGVSREFGRLVEVAAVTGARVGQLAQLLVEDAKDDRGSPHLMMPSSRKGRGQKKITHRPVPGSTELLVRLKQSRHDVAPNAPLLTRPDGIQWRKSDHTRPFRRAVEAAGLDPADVTIYALRHSSIVRQLLAGVPIRVVAVNHDTSVAMIEKTYSKYIGDHSDAITRRALLDLTEPLGGNVVARRER